MSHTIQPRADGSQPNVCVFSAVQRSNSAQVVIRPKDFEVHRLWDCDKKQRQQACSYTDDKRQWTDIKFSIENLSSRISYANFLAQIAIHEVRESRYGSVCSHKSSRNSKHRNVFSALCLKCSLYVSLLTVLICQFWTMTISTLS